MSLLKRAIYSLSILGAFILVFTCLSNASWGTDAVLADVIPSDSRDEILPGIHSLAACMPTELRTSQDTLLPPEYSTFTPPPIGGSYCDETFGTEVKHLTDSSKAQMTNSEISYFNIDNSYFLAVDDNITYLMDGLTGEKIKPLSGQGVRPWWMRWPRADYYTSGGAKMQFDPVQHFYKYDGNEVRLYDLNTMDYIVLHKFNEYTEIGPAGGEGDLSNDGRYWVLHGVKADGGLTLFVYDLLEDLKGAESPFNVGMIGGNGPGVDYATISPSGMYVVIAWDAGSEDPFEGRYGVEVYQRATWEFVRRVHPSRIHYELGYDAFGYETFFATAGNSSTDLASFNVPDLALGDVVAVRLDDGVGTKLLDVPRWVYQTSSFPIVQNGYVFFAFEVKSEVPEQDWAPYWGEIVAVPTDGSGKAIRLVRHRTRQTGDLSHKAYQPDFITSSTGEIIVYQSTYGIAGTDLYMFNSGLGGETFFVDVPPEHPYRQDIELLYMQGYVKGCNLFPLMYCPERIMDRAETTVFVERGIHNADYTPTNPTQVVFTDVALDAWYANWVHGLWEDGYTDGCDPDTLKYCPEEEHTRAEGCVFYLRMKYGKDYQPPEPPKGYFKDVDPNIWYAKWVDACWEAGIAEPCATQPDRFFCPEEGLTRAVGAYMMVQAKGLSLP
ncbi:MAG: hypothetical protein A2Z14_05705 [Chloroflexi bacterium RBG_16_48_8]|nr:MAG: hypothetical protein A2Z14_05705 [Chloroflexi bacterium RBG_16_48_8]